MPDRMPLCLVTVDLSETDRKCAYRYGQPIFLCEYYSDANESLYCLLRFVGDQEGMSFVFPYDLETSVHIIEKAEREALKRMKENDC